MKRIICLIFALFIHLACLTACASAQEVHEQPLPTPEETPIPVPTEELEPTEDYEIIRIEKGEDRSNGFSTPHNSLVEIDKKLLESIEEHNDEDVRYYVRIECINKNSHYLDESMEEFQYEGYTLRQYEYMFWGSMVDTEEAQDAAREKYGKAYSAFEKWDKETRATEKKIEEDASKEFERLAKRGLEILEDSAFDVDERSVYLDVAERSAYLTEEQIVNFPVNTSMEIKWQYRITFENETKDKEPF